MCKYRSCSAMIFEKSTTNKSGNSQFVQAQHQNSNATCAHFFFFSFFFTAEVFGYFSRRHHILIELAIFFFLSFSVSFFLNSYECFMYWCHLLPARPGQ